MKLIRIRSYSILVEQEAQFENAPQTLPGNPGTD
jgi:hypothetical protein